jgi:hypothetical protein
VVRYVCVPAYYGYIQGRDDFFSCNGCTFERCYDYVRIARYDRDPSRYAGELIMAIDTAALRKFQDLWGPVLEAIPAVLEATAKKADVERELRIKQIEIDEAGKKIDAAFVEADKRLSSVNSEMEQVMQQKEKALAEIEAAKKAQAEKVAAAEKAFSVTEMEWVQKTSALQAQFAKVEANLAQKLADADAQYAEKTAALEADVKDLEKRKAAAEKALDALRSKLG